MTVNKFAINSGRLNTRIIVERDSANTFADEYGNISPVFETFVERWAQVIPVRGKEFIANNQIQAELDHTILMRYDRETKQINTDMRLRIKGTDRILNIVSVRDVSLQHQELQLDAKELVKDTSDG